MHPPPRAQREPLVGPGEVEHQVADLTVTMSADVSLDAVQRKLAENDQWLPLDGDPELSVGQLVANNSTGPMRLGFGGWRDLALLIQFRSQKSGLITVGARTMKNVAGYDVTKFLVGQRELLGQLVTVSTRTYKRPPGAMIASFAVKPELIQTLIPTSARPHWALLRGEQIHCGYFGDDKAMTFFHNVLAQYSPTVERLDLAGEIEKRTQLWAKRSAEKVFRLSVPPANAIDVMKTLALDDSAADLSFGIIVGSCTGADAARVTAIGRANGSITFDDQNPLETMTGPQRALLDRVVAAF